LFEGDKLERLKREAAQMRNVISDHEDNLIIINDDIHKFAVDFGDMSEEVIDAFDHTRVLMHLGLLRQQDLEEHFHRLVVEPFAPGPGVPNADDVKRMAEEFRRLFRDPGIDPTGGTGTGVDMGELGVSHFDPQGIIPGVDVDRLIGQEAELQREISKLELGAEGLKERIFQNTEELDKLVRFRREEADLDKGLIDEMRQGRDQLAKLMDEDRNLARIIESLGPRSENLDPNQSALFEQALTRVDDLTDEIDDLRDHLHELGEAADGAGQDLDLDSDIQKLVDSIENDRRALEEHKDNVDADNASISRHLAEQKDISVIASATSKELRILKEHIEDLADEIRQGSRGAFGEPSGPRSFEAQRHFHELQDLLDRLTHGEQGLVDLLEQSRGGARSQVDVISDNETVRRLKEQFDEGLLTNEDFRDVIREFADVIENFDEVARSLEGDILPGGPERIERLLVQQREAQAHASRFPQEERRDRVERGGLISIDPDAFAQKLEQNQQQHQTNFFTGINKVVDQIARHRIAVEKLINRREETADVSGPLQGFREFTHLIAGMLDDEERVLQERHAILSGQFTELVGQHEARQQANLPNDPELENRIRSLMAELESITDRIVENEERFTSLQESEGSVTAQAFASERFDKLNQQIEFLDQALQKDRTALTKHSDTIDDITSRLRRGNRPIGGGAPGGGRSTDVGNLLQNLHDRITSEEFRRVDLRRDVDREGVTGRSSEFITLVDKATESIRRLNIEFNQIANDVTHGRIEALRPFIDEVHRASDQLKQLQSDSASSWREIFGGALDGVRRSDEERNEIDNRRLLASRKLDQAHATLREEVIKMSHELRPIGGGAPGGGRRRRPVTEEEVTARSIERGLQQGTVELEKFRDRLVNAANALFDVAQNARLKIGGGADQQSAIELTRVLSQSVREIHEAVLEDKNDRLPMMDSVLKTLRDFMTEEQRGSEMILRHQASELAGKLLKETGGSPINRDLPIRVADAEDAAKLGRLELTERFLKDVLDDFVNVIEKISTQLEKDERQHRINAENTRQIEEARQPRITSPRLAQDRRADLIRQRLGEAGHGDDVALLDKLTAQSNEMSSRISKLVQEHGHEVLNFIALDQQIRAFMKENISTEDEYNAFKTKLERIPRSREEVFDQLYKLELAGRPSQRLVDLLDLLADEAQKFDELQPRLNEQRRKLVAIAKPVQQAILIEERQHRGLTPEGFRQPPPVTGGAPGGGFGDDSGFARLIDNQKQILERLREQLGGFSADVLQAHRDNVEHNVELQNVLDQMTAAFRKLGSLEAAQGQAEAARPATGGGGTKPPTRRLKTAEEFSDDDQERTFRDHERKVRSLETTFERLTHELDTLRHELGTGKIAEDDFFLSSQKLRQEIEKLVRLAPADFGSKLGIQFKRASDEIQNQIDKFKRLAEQNVVLRDLMNIAEQAEGGINKFTDSFDDLTQSVDASRGAMVILRREGDRMRGLDLRDLTTELETAQQLLLSLKSTSASRQAQGEPVTKQLESDIQRTTSRVEALRVVLAETLREAIPQLNQLAQAAVEALPTPEVADQEQHVKVTTDADTSALQKVTEFEEKLVSLEEQHQNIIRQRDTAGPIRDNELIISQLKALAQQYQNLSRAYSADSVEFIHVTQLRLAVVEDMLAEGDLIKNKLADITEEQKEETKAEEEANREHEKTRLALEKQRESMTQLVSAQAELIRKRRDENLANDDYVVGLARIAKGYQELAGAQQVSSDEFFAFTRQANALLTEKNRILDEEKTKQAEAGRIRTATARAEAALESDAEKASQRRRQAEERGRQQKLSQDQEDTARLIELRDVLEQLNDEIRGGITDRQRLVSEFKAIGAEADKIAKRRGDITSAPRRAAEALATQARDVGAAVAADEEGKAARQEDRIKSITTAYTRLNHEVERGGVSTRRARAEFGRYQQAFGALARDLEIGSQEAVRFGELSVHAADQARRAVQREKNEIAGTGSAWEQASNAFQRAGLSISRLGESVSKFDNQLRGLAVLGIFLFAQQLLTGLTGLVGGLGAVASSAIFAGGALGGSFVSGIAQAIPAIGLLAAALQQVKGVTQALTEADLVRQQGFHKNLKGIQDQNKDQNKAADAADRVANAQQGLQDAQDKVPEALRRVKDAQDGLAVAQKRETDAQKALTRARKEARDQLEDLIQAERDAELAARGAVLDQADAQERLRTALASGASDVELQRANLGVLEADQGRGKADADLVRSRQAVRTGRNIEGTDAVVGAKAQIEDAKKGVRDARRQITDAKKAVDDAHQSVKKAERGLTSAGRSTAVAADAALASQDKLLFLLQQMTPAQLRLFGALEKLRLDFKVKFAGITDIIVDSFVRIADTADEILLNPAFLAAAEGMAKGLAGAFDKFRIHFFEDPEKLQKFFDIIDDGTKNISPLERIAENIGDAFLNIALAAGPSLHRILEDLADFSDDLKGLTDNKAGLEDFFKIGTDNVEAWGTLAKDVVLLFAALAGDGQEQGLSLVQDFDGAVKDATQWVRENQGLVKQFFKDSGDVVRSIAGLLAALGQGILDVFKPELLDRFARFLSDVVVPALVGVTNAVGTIVDALLAVFDLKILGINVGGFLKLLVTLGISIVILTSIVTALGGAIALIFLQAGHFLRIFTIAFGIFGKINGPAGKFVGILAEMAGKIGLLKPLEGILGGISAKLIARAPKGAGSIADDLASVIGGPTATTPGGQRLRPAPRRGLLGKLGFKKVVVEEVDEAIKAGEKVVGNSTGKLGLKRIVSSEAGGVAKAGERVAAGGSAKFGSTFLAGLKGFAKSSAWLAVGVASVQGIITGIKTGNLSSALRDFTSSLTFGLVKSAEEVALKASNDLARLLKATATKPIPTATPLPQQRVPFGATQVTPGLALGPGGTLIQDAGPKLTQAQEAAKKFFDRIEDIRRVNKDAAKAFAGIPQMQKDLIDGVRNREPVSYFDDLIDRSKRMRERWGKDFPDMANFLSTFESDTKKRMQEVSKALAPNRLRIGFAFQLALDPTKWRDIIDKFVAEGRGLPGKLRSQARDGMLAMVQQLVAQGDLPAKEARKITARILAEFDYKPKAAKHAEEAILAMVDKMQKGGKLTADQADVVKEGIDKKFAQLPHLGRRRTQEAIHAMVDKFVEKGQLPKDQAEKIKDRVDGQFQKMKVGASRKSADTATAIAHNLHAGVVAVSGELGLMGINVNGILKAFGVGQVKLPPRLARILPGNAPPVLTDRFPGSKGGVFASGGMIGLPGERGKDEVHATLARGEMVLNAFHQRYLSPAVQAYYGHSLSHTFKRIRGEHAGGSGPGFRLGTDGGGSPLLDGHPGNIAPALRSLIALMKRLFPALHVSSTTDHSTRTSTGGISDHVSGHAVDLAASEPVMHRAVEYIKRSGIARRLKQGIHNPGLAINDGRPAPGGGAAFFKQAWPQHVNHIHLAVGAFTAAFNAVVARIKRQKFEFPVEGKFKQLGQAMLDRARRAANRLIQRRLAQQDGGADAEGIPQGTDQRDIISKAARRAGIPAKYLWGVFGAESDFGRNKNTSSAGAQGPFQFMPGTADSYIPGGRANINNFAAAAVGAARYLRHLFNIFKNWREAIGHYNSGEGGNVTNPETRAYIPKVINLAGTFAKGGIVPGGEGIPVNITAHAGEVVLNKPQQQRVAAWLGTSIEGLQARLGFHGGPTAFQGGGTIRKSEREIAVRFSPQAERDRIRRIVAGIFSLPIVPLVGWKDIVDTTHEALTAINNLGKSHAVRIRNLRQQVRQVRRGGVSASERRIYTDLLDEIARLAGDTRKALIGRLERQRAQLAKGGIKDAERPKVQRIDERLSNLRQSDPRRASRAIDAIIGQDGLLDQLEARREVIANREVANLTKITFAIRRVGRGARGITVRKALNDIQIANKELLLGQRDLERVITIRDVAAKALSGVNRQITQSTRRIANISARIARLRRGGTTDAEQKIIDSLVVDRGDIRQQRAALKGKRNTLSDRLDKLRADASEAMSKVFDAEVAKQQAQVDAITKRADKREAGFGIRERMLAVFGNRGGLDAVLRDRVSSINTEIKQLRSKLAAAKKTGNTELVDAINAQIADLQATAAEVAKQRVQNIIDDVTRQAKTARRVWGSGSGWLSYLATLVH
jgi:DNA repair exonuclease SbcCD ATPase subunit